MAISYSAASDIANMALDLYLREPMLSQSTTNKPLLKFLEKNKEEFPSGKTNVSLPVQFTFMSNTSGFLQGYSQADTLLFAQAQNALRANYPWYECHAGLVISGTELKQDGISIDKTVGNSTTQHARTELTRLTSIMNNRVKDFMESWQRAKNSMLWNDGTQDAKQIPGVQSILFSDPSANTVGGLSQATYPLWRNRSRQGLAPSPENQTLTRALREEVILLRKYMGKPDKILCGSDFLFALMTEIEKKGVYTMSGFTGKTDVGMGSLSLTDIGVIEYDPTLDDQGLSKHCFIFDSSRFKLYPMEQEWDKAIDPARPYDTMVLLKSMTVTGALCCNQLNGQDRLSIN